MNSGNFRAVPDGQYTQTIYSLIRDGKYSEVSHSVTTDFSDPFSLLYR